LCEYYNKFPLRSHSVVPGISIAPLQVHYYSAANWYWVGVNPKRFTGICEWRTCPRFLRGG